MIVIDVVHFSLVCLLKLILNNSKPHNQMCDWYQKCFCFVLQKSLSKFFYMTRTFDSEVSLHSWVLWPTVRHSSSTVLIFINFSNQNLLHYAYFFNIWTRPFENRLTRFVGQFSLATLLHMFGTEAEIKCISHIKSKQEILFYSILQRGFWNWHSICIY